MVSATVGCRSRTMGRQLAQLAQCAPSLDLKAAVSPKPPMKNGNDAVVLAIAWSGVILRIWRKHSHMLAS